MIRRRKWTLFWILIPILLVGAFMFLLIHYLIDPNLYQNVIQKSLTAALGREVSIGKATIHLREGVGISFEDFRIKDSPKASDLLQSKKLILIAKLLPLLKREVRWKRIVLEQPIFHLSRDRKGQFNFSESPLTGEKVKASQQQMLQTLSTFFGGSLTIRDGKISFSDEGLGDLPLLTEMRSFHLKLAQASLGQPFSFHLSGKIVHAKKEGLFSISGLLQNIPENLDVSKGSMEAKVEIKGIDTFHFWPYLKPLLPMRMISGGLDLKGDFQGDFSRGFKTSAKIKWVKMIFDYPQVFSYRLNPEWMNIDLQVDYDLKNIKVPRFSIELPEVSIKGKGKIYAIGSKEMGMEAEAQSSVFDLAEGKKFIPFRIITREVSEPLFRAEGRGPVQILSVKLSGKIPEIDHCDQLQNAHVLSVEMMVKKAWLKLPWNLPPLEDLKGHLIFKDGRLTLKNVEGRVFHSDIDQASGTLYPLLLVPTLQVQCEGLMDLLDLPSFGKIEGLSEDLSQFLSPIYLFSGKTHYRISAKGVLKAPLRFQHQGTYRLSKTRLSHQQIPFPVSIGEGKIELSNESFQCSGANVEFGNCSLGMSASWKKEEKGAPLEIMANGTVDLKTLFRLSQAPFFPEEIRLKAKGIESLSGAGELSFKGQSQRGSRPFSYEGEVVSRGIYLFPKGFSSPFIFKDGTLSFSDIGVGFSKAKLFFNNSSLTLDGSVKDEKIDLSTSGSVDLRQLHLLLQSTLFPDQVRLAMDGVQELTGGAALRLKWLGKTKEWVHALREGEIHLKEVSFRHPKMPVPFSQIEGSFFLSPKQIRFDGLKGKLGDSPLAASGALSWIPPSFPTPSSPKAGTVEQPGGSGRRLSLQFFSSQLDLDSLFPKKKETTPTSFKDLRDWLSNWSLDGRVEIEQGKYRGLHFQGVKGEIKTVDGKLTFGPFQFRGAEGDLWGEGWIQPTTNGIQFDIKPRLSNMEAKSFIRTLLQKGEEEKVRVTGRVHVDKVELRGEGEDSQKMKGSLNGSLRVEFENGVIERGNILAKIFSILNVSQLLRGRFPDLKTRGLPYQHILGNIQIKDGIASTDNLIVDSDAMKITLLGKVDLGKNLIDARIGVHPLVTLDTVVSKVPIAGYILTGKDKAFLSYVFEVKGDLDDPKIEDVPIKGLGESSWGIIKRLLETPMRPFQKTPLNNKDNKPKGSEFKD
jgi:uncharacterized protein YhdP